MALSTAASGNNVPQRAVVIAAATALTALAFAAPAHAATGAAPSATTGITAAAAPPARDLGDCPANYACLWPGSNWTGSFRWQGTYNNTPVGSNINNNSRSSANWSDSRIACFWDNDNGTGDHMSEGPHSIRADLRLDPKPSGGNWYHKISALTWNNC
ncbi:peptidase inhibitor family I36 protein [Actinoplanes sp. NPDC049681]|uniref:peptidase inhibitor family I36 protein n=1 Tax=Actinoplanes sp. NPDC049681 TaxID=3363905 RepID=UPI0037A94946